MATAPPPRRPWLLIGASVVLAVLLVYVVVGAYMPSRQHAAGLEAEIRDVYRREAELQGQLEQARARADQLQKQLRALAGERDALVLRVTDLERALLKRSR
jgi:septal ring factor EnvC (AmiA/AmiB activator)